MANAAPYRDLSKTCLVLKVAFGINLLVAAVGFWSNWLQVEMLQQVAAGVQIATSELAANDVRQWQVGRLTFLAFLITAILFMRWTYLSNRNARSLVAGDLQYSPGWAIGWYFIPVALLWKPYLAMKEILRASNPSAAEDWQTSSVPQLASVWWLIWVLWNTGLLFVSQKASHAETFDEVVSASRLALASFGLDLALGIVGILLVSRVQTWQSEKHRRLATAAI